MIPLSTKAGEINQHIFIGTYTHKDENYKHKISTERLRGQVCTGMGKGLFCQLNDRHEYSLY